MIGGNVMINQLNAITPTNESGDSSATNLAQLAVNFTNQTSIIPENSANFAGNTAPDSNHENTPQNGNDLVNVAVEQLRTGNYKAAEEAFLKAVKINQIAAYQHPYSNEIRDMIRSRVIVNRGAGELDVDPKTLELYKNLYEAEPENQYHFINYANALGSVDSRDAIKLLEENLQTHDTVNTYLLLSFNHQSIREYDKAFYYINKAIEINPRHSDTFLYKGNIYIALKNWKEAIKSYELAYQVNPTLQNRANIENVKFLSISSENITPEFINKLVTEAVYVYEISYFQDALKKYAFLIQLNVLNYYSPSRQELADFYFKTADCYYQLEKVASQKIINLLIKSINYEHGDGEKHFLVGRYYLELGNYEEAANFFAEALNLQPYNRLYYKYYKQARFPELVTDLKEMLYNFVKDYPKLVISTGFLSATAITLWIYKIVNKFWNGNVVLEKKKILDALNEITYIYDLKWQLDKNTFRLKVESDQVRINYDKEKNDVFEAENDKYILEVTISDSRKNNYVKNIEREIFIDAKKFLEILEKLFKEKCKSMKITQKDKLLIVENIKIDELNSNIENIETKLKTQIKKKIQNERKNQRLKKIDIEKKSKGNIPVKATEEPEEKNNTDSGPFLSLKEIDREKENISIRMAEESFDEETSISKENISDLKEIDTEKKSEEKIPASVTEETFKKESKVTKTAKTKNKKYNILDEKNNIKPKQLSTIDQEIYEQTHDLGVSWNLWKRERLETEEQLNTEQKLLEEKERKKEQVKKTGSELSKDKQAGTKAFVKNVSGRDVGKGSQKFSNQKHREFDFFKKQNSESKEPVEKKVIIYSPQEYINCIADHAIRMNCYYISWLQTEGLDKFSEINSEVYYKAVSLHLMRFMSMFGDFLFNYDKKEYSFEELKLMGNMLIHVAVMKKQQHIEEILRVNKCIDIICVQFLKKFFPENYMIKDDPHGYLKQHTEQEYIAVRNEIDLAHTDLFNSLLPLWKFQAGKDLDEVSYLQIIETQLRELNKFLLFPFKQDVIGENQIALLAGHQDNIDACAMNLVIIGEIWARWIDSGLSPSVKENKEKLHTEIPKQIALIKEQYNLSEDFVKFLNESRNLRNQFRHNPKTKFNSLYIYKIAQSSLRYTNKVEELVGTLSKFSSNSL